MSEFLRSYLRHVKLWLCSIFVCGGLFQARTLTAQPQRSPCEHTIEELNAVVCQSDIHGNLSQTEAFGYACVGGGATKLQTILQAPNLHRCWQNAVIMSGTIENPAAWQELVVFLQKSFGKVTEPIPAAVLQAKGSVFRSLAVLANRAARVGDETSRTAIIEFLEKGVRPSSWETIRWVSPYERDRASRNLVLSEQSIRALGLSGDNAAADYLRNLDSALSAIQFNDDLPVFPESLKDWMPSDVTPEWVDTLRKSVAESRNTNAAVRQALSIQDFLANPGIYDRRLH